MNQPDEDDEKTRIIRRPPRLPQAADDDDTRPSLRRPSGGQDEDEAEMTRLVGPTKRISKIEEESGDAPDPVVGWLVVLKGPGRGNARSVGYGQNSLGRDPGERISLGFGDASLSRSKHCFIIYEPRKREFILRPGDGANLTYLNGTLVTEPQPMKAGDLIEAGKTTLRFVPFCGPGFDWQDQPEAVGGV
jgi:hypothetical protein